MTVVRSAVRFLPVRCRKSLWSQEYSGSRARRWGRSGWSWSRSVGDPPLSLAGGVEHLLSERALLSNQVLGEVEHRVQNLLRVARSVTRRAGSACGCPKVVARHATC